MKSCNNCGQEIDFKQLPNKRWKPTNPDGSDHKCQGNQGNGKVNSDSTDMLGTILTRTNDQLVLKIGEYKLDIRKEAK